MRLNHPHKFKKKTKFETGVPEMASAYSYIIYA
jgi:hypothetical protein